MMQFITGLFTGLFELTIVCLVALMSFGIFMTLQVVIYIILTIMLIF